jgi:MFS family permease
MALDESTRASLYYTTLLGWVGCIADSQEAAAWFGDDIDYRAGVFDVDLKPLPFLGYLLQRAGQGDPPVRRAGKAAGVLAGGFLADRTARHGDVAAIGFGLSALLTLAIAALALPSVVFVVAMGLAGLLMGMIMPSRDMLVRRAAPPGAAGSAFGIVSTGFNIGGIIGPMLFGWIMDHHMPQWVFGAAVFFMSITCVFGFVADRRAPGGLVEAKPRT